MGAVGCVGATGAGNVISTGATGAGGMTTGVPTGAVAPGGIGVIVVGPVGPVSVTGCAIGNSATGGIGAGSG